MKRPDFLYVMSLGRGGRAAGACLDNRWYVHHGWSDVARAASLAVRRAKAAARGASEGVAESSATTSAGSCPSSSGGEGGETADDGRASGKADVSALNLAPDGKTYVGFTDNSVEPPRNHYLPVGGEEDGWKVVSADYDSEEAVLEKDGRRIAVNLGGGPTKGKAEDGGQRSAAGGQSEDGGDGIPETIEYDGEGFDLGDAWEDFQESGIWSMGDTHREGIREGIRERYEQEGDVALEHGERKFLEQYEKWESVQSMAGMIVEGGGGEPPPFAETQARLREAVDGPAATDEERNEAQLVCRAEMEAARRIWEAKAGQAFYTKYGRSPETAAEARQGEQLAGVPYGYEGSLADGYMENRRGRDARRRRALANRAEIEAHRRLANVGWTDAAREVSLRVRQNKARIRELLKDRPDGTTYRDAGGTWIKRNGDVELVRVDGLYAAGQNNGRFITELAAGRPGDYFDPYSKGTINAMEHYGYLTPAQGAAARAYYGYGDTANRIPGRRFFALANVGWTDEARAAALAVRRAKASGAASAPDGGIRANGRYKTENGKTVFVPDPPPLLSPPREGTIINVGGWISMMMNGKPVRIGSTKVLCVLPDGQLGVKLGGKAYPIGKPSKWRTGTGGPQFVMMGGKYYLDVGKGCLDLATGRVRVKPAETVTRGGGTIKIEIGRYNPFTGPGVEIPPELPDVSQRRHLQS